MLAERGFQARVIGEIAIRCADLEAMTNFYRHIVGLEVLEEFPDDGVFLAWAKVMEGILRSWHCFTIRPGVLNCMP